MLLNSAVSPRILYCPCLKLLSSREIVGGHGDAFFNAEGTKGDKKKE